MTSAKLAEAFLKGRRQDNTTNSAVSGHRIQMGWGFIQGDNTFQIEEAVTFPQAFSSQPVVLANGVGSVATSGGTPDEPSDFSEAFGGNTATAINCYAISSSGFNVQFNRADSGNLSSSFYWGYCWIAIGPA